MTLPNGKGFRDSVVRQVFNAVVEWFAILLQHFKDSLCELSLHLLAHWVRHELPLFQEFRNGGILLLDANRLLRLLDAQEL